MLEGRVALTLITEPDAISACVDLSLQDELGNGVWIYKLWLPAGVVAGLVFIEAYAHQGSEVGTRTADLLKGQPKGGTLQVDSRK